MKQSGIGGHPWQKAILLGSLYISQMLGLSFVLMAVPAILRQTGAGLDDIGRVYLLGFFWSLNVLWAPLVDRYGSPKHGHYRSWLLVMQPLLILVILAASFFSVTGQLPVLMVLFAGLSAVAATQDIAADALAVTILEPGERGLGNGIQAAGNLIGGMIGGGVVLITYGWLGWRGSMWTLAAGTALPLIAILRFREPTLSPNRCEKKANFYILVRFFRRPAIWRWIPVLLVFRAGNMINYGMITPILVDLGWSLERIGFYLNIIGPLFGIAGSALGGWIVSRWGRKSAMLFSVQLVALATSGLVLPARGIEHPLLVFAVIGMMMTAYGAGFAVMYTMIMDKSDPASAGTDFTLQMSISGFFAFAASGLAMRVAEAIGYSGVLAACLGLAAGSFFLIRRYDDFESTQSMRPPRRIQQTTVTIKRQHPQSGAVVKP